MSNPVGAPPKYKSPKELDVLIETYFGENEDNHLTITGLARALDLTRKGLLDYENKDNPQFGYTIKRAKIRVEEYLEQRLFEANATGSIFNLKNNFGWKDKTEREHSGNIGLGELMDDIDGDTTDL